MTHAYDYMDRPPALVMADAAITAYVAEVCRCLNIARRYSIRSYDADPDLNWMYNHLAGVAKFNAMQAFIAVTNNPQLMELIGTADLAEVWVQLDLCNPWVL